jgi:cephalosporin hydroxylase
MNNYNNRRSLREYVSVEKNKNIKELEEKGLSFLGAAAKNKLAYEIDWLGIPVIQSPEDLILMQELIFKIRPDFIIETGIAHGGGLIFYASLMELLGKGKVIGVDIEIREHNRKAIEAHPLFKRIELIEDSSIAQSTVEKIRKKIPSGSKVIVCLDSDHAKTHVLKELELYKEFVITDCYIVVFDTITAELVKSGIADQKYLNNSPMEAVEEFLKINKNFAVDKQFNKLYVSYNRDGYLKRIK